MTTSERRHVSPVDGPVPLPEQGRAAPRHELLTRCAACGAGDPAGTVLGWTMEPATGNRWCPSCSRAHLRDIESRLPGGSW
ncbi:hypothetical protein [Nakamurella leprariae]|uniref:Uncharacterized protein n=1 Tax=Nakamurella leprariae TaxID=2803911 RepID=A0A939BZ45_9ACTN|nr:hypothetical protein [Nakamurella leprariae]MBM9467306.1 hypothetical protein [Nakamurella leprariae]